MADLGDQQFGSYRLLRLIGKGGQASVYLGQHLRLQQRLAAIKILNASVSQQDIEAFQQEANTIAALQHPHVVNVLDFDVQQGTPFLVMEYYPDGSLRERHPRGERVPLSTIVSYVKPIAEALQYAHDHRLIHRDVKAANMLIGRQGEIVLSDFGIVAIAHSTSSLGTQNFAGTVPYMAPEQITQRPRRESDQYALAVVVYEWLCGELPFLGTPQEIAIKHLTVEPPSLRRKLPDVSPMVERAILKALAKEPKDRFASVLDFAAALEQAALGRLNLSTLNASSQILSNTVPMVTPLEAAQYVRPDPAAQTEAIDVGKVAPGQMMAPRNSTVAIPARAATNMWRVGGRQLLATVIGLILCGLVYYGIAFLIYSLYPSLMYAYILSGLILVLPLFFGFIQGPWVGLCAAGIGCFVADYLVSLTLTIPPAWEFDVVVTVLGLLAGLAVLVTRGRYKNLNYVLLTALLGSIGAGIAEVVALAAPPLNAALSAIPVFVLLLLLLFAYNALSRSGKKDHP